MTGIVEFLGGKVGGIAVTAAVKRAHEFYLQAAREILEEELANGYKTVQDIADHDKLAARVFDYAELATKGKARRNLRLLAQLIVKELNSPTVYPDLFTEFFDVLASLSHQEIIVLARYHAIYDKVSDAPPTGAFADISANLVGKTLESQDELLSIIQGLSRTGLLFQRSSGPATDIPSSKMFRLMKLVNFEKALNEIP